MAGVNYLRFSGRPETLILTYPAPRSKMGPLMGRVNETESDRVFRRYWGRLSGWEMTLRGRHILRPS